MLEMPQFSLLLGLETCSKYYKDDVKTLNERLTLVEGKTREPVKHFEDTTGLLVDQAGGSISYRKSHDFGNKARRGKHSLVNEIKKIKKSWGGGGRGVLRGTVSHM